MRIALRHLVLIAASLAAMTMASPSAARAQSQDRDLIETIRSTGGFTTFARALAEAGLTGILTGPGPFTVLAPTDAAFAKLPKATLDALFKDKAALRSMLLFHVIAGKLTAADFAKLTGSTRKTVEGTNTKVMVMGSTVMIGTANIVQSDIMASNGIVHGIDAVLLLPAR